MDPELLELYAEGAPDDEVAVIVRLADPVALPTGVRVVAQFDRIVTLRLPRREIKRVRSEPSVRSMKRAQLHGAPPAHPDETQSTLPGTTGNPAKSCSCHRNSGEATLEPLPSDQRRPDGNLPTGRGVVVAHIDWGVDFAHPDFRDTEGRTRLIGLWDQSAPVDPKRPNLYGYGRIYDSGDIDRALTAQDPYAALGYYPSASDSGFGSHGTHTLGISAGNGRAGGPVGLAPEAKLVFVHLSTYTADGPSLLGDSVALLEAFDFIARVAGPCPLVVNASLGRQAGDHTGQSLTEQGMDAFLVAAPGRAICQSTGNYFDRSIHACGTLRPGERRTLHLLADVADRTPNEVDLWYPGVDRFQITLRPPGGSPEFHAAPGERAQVTIDGREVGNLYHRLHDPNNGDNEVTLFLYRAAPPGEWELTLFGEDVADGRFHAWVERDAACARCQARFTQEDSDPTTTTGTICNGLRTLAVGAYDAHREDRPLAPFSSSGLTRDGRQKPDCVAPGVCVLAARSRPNTDVQDPPLLTCMSGTSMACPHVTGTVALMFEAAGRPLFIEETRRLLLAHTDPPPPDADHAERVRLGSGYLNTQAAVAAAQRTGHRLAAPVRRSHGATSSNEAYEHEPLNDGAPKQASAGAAFGNAGENKQSERFDQMRTRDSEIAGQEPVEDAQAERDDFRRAAAPLPFQFQIPIGGGAPAIALPVGGPGTPLAFTIPLGGPPAAPPLVVPSGFPEPSSAGEPLPAASAGSEAPVAVAQTDFPFYHPPVEYDSTTERFDQMRTRDSEIAGQAPVEYEAADETAADFSAGLPDSFAIGFTPDDDAEAKRDDRRWAAAPLPFQFQIPIGGGAPALALPVGGAGSPFAFTVPFGVTAPPTAPPVVAPPGVPSPAPSPAEPLAAAAAGTEAPVVIAGVDVPLYQPPGADASTESALSSDFGERVLKAAEACARPDGAAPNSSAALLASIFSGAAGADAESEAEAADESMLSPLGFGGHRPTATTLFNAFVYPDHPLRPRRALHRHYALRFEVLAPAGAPLPDLVPRPGDLLLRVACGEGWGHIAVVASPGLYWHDRLADAGLRGEGYPLPLPGRHVHVVEAGPRPRSADDRFARRLCDANGFVLADTLLLRPLRPDRLSIEAEAAPGLDGATAGSDPDTPAQRPPALRRGASGAAVREAQQKLNRVHADSVALGLPGLAGCPLSEDGRFDQRTEQAVSDFQQQVFGDPAKWNGVIGADTWVQLDLLTGPPSPKTPPTPAASPRRFARSRSGSVRDYSFGEGRVDAEAGDVNRNSPDYVRWLQSSLNQILGTQLVADGVMGSNTRTAIRSFQQRSGLTADGLVGSRTEEALRKVLAGGGGVPAATPCTTFDGFPQGTDTILPSHQPIFLPLARRILVENITNADATGFASSEGSDPENLALGQRRAERVARELRATLDRLRPGSANTLTVTTRSRGEGEQIAGGDRERNRRVTVCLQKPIPAQSAEVDFVVDDDNDHVVNQTAPVTTFVGMGLWNAAYDAAGNVRNSRAEGDNFVGSDRHRFYIRVRDPAATTATVTVNWRTLRSDLTDDDAPANQTVTLSATASGSKVFVSKALMLVTDDKDANQSTHSGLAAPHPDAGVRTRGQSNHRLRRGRIDGSVRATYRPASGSPVEQALPIFRRRPTDFRRRVKIRVINYGSHATAAFIAGQFAHANARWNQIGVSIDALGTVDRPVPAAALDASGQYPGGRDSTHEVAALRDLIPITPDNTVTVVFVRLSGTNAYTTLVERTLSALGERYFMFVRTPLDLNDDTLAHELFHVLFNRGDVAVADRFYTFNTNPPTGLPNPSPDVRTYRRIQDLHSPDPDNDPGNANILNWARRRRTARFPIAAGHSAPTNTTGNNITEVFS